MVGKLYGATILNVCCEQINAIYTMAEVSCLRTGDWHWSAARDWRLKMPYGCFVSVQAVHNGAMGNQHLLWEAGSSHSGDNFLMEMLSILRVAATMVFRLGDPSFSFPLIFRVLFESLLSVTAPKKNCTPCAASEGYLKRRRTKSHGS